MLFLQEEEENESVIKAPLGHHHRPKQLTVDHSKVSHHDPSRSYDGAEAQDKSDKEPHPDPVLVSATSEGVAVLR